MGPRWAEKLISVAFALALHGLRFVYVFRAFLKYSDTASGICSCCVLNRVKHSDKVAISDSVFIAYQYNVLNWTCRQTRKNN